MEIKVKIGSNNVVFNIDEYHRVMSVEKFIGQVLKNIKIHNSNHYGLYECLNGVERLLDNESDIITYWKSNRELNVQLKISKKFAIGTYRRLLSQKIAKSYYKKSKPSSLPRQNKEILNVQSHQDSPYLCKYHKNKLNNQLNEKISENSNFLQFLYLKLREQNCKTQKYTQLINSCENSSESSSHRSSTSSLTSNLESLV